MSADLQERIYQMRRDADQLECQMRGIELGVFLFEKQTAHLKRLHEAAKEERQACIDAIKDLKAHSVTSDTSDVARTLNAAISEIAKRNLQD